MRKKEKYRFFSIHTITGTIFVVVISLVLSIIPQNIDFFNPIEKALKDFTLTDVVFQRRLDDESGVVKKFTNHEINDKIILVNIGGASVGRAGLAEQLEIINRYSPAVVGIDAFFKRPGDPIADSLLSEAFRNTNNLVLVSKLESWDSSKNRFTELTKSAEMFSRHATTGFANFITGGSDGYLTTRRFSAKEPVNDQTELCFTGKILSLVDKGKFGKLSKRGKPTEIINYSGNLEHFFRLDYTDVMDTTRDLSFLKDKIVLMGYLGEPMGNPSLEDVFFTPLNPEMAGRSVPDMYGITVHANILAMMLGEYYIAQAPEWLDPFLALVICLLNVSIFLFIGHKYRSSSQLMMRIVQILQGIILTGLLIYLLAEKDIYVEFTLSLTLLFLCADLTEIYEGSLHNAIAAYQLRRKRPATNSRSQYYKKRRLFSK